MHVTSDTSCHGSGAEVPRRLVYGVDEVAALIGGVSRRTAYRRMTGGEIPSFMLGGTRVVAHDDLMAYVESHRQAGAA